MNYYRAEWTVQDIAEFAAHVFTDPTASDEARTESAEMFCALFAEGGPVEAYGGP